jgi:hypothetical protein
MNHKALLAGLALVTAGPIYSQAQAADLITNGSFETGGPAAGGADYLNIGSTAINGWTVINKAQLALAMRGHSEAVADCGVKAFPW